MSLSSHCARRGLPTPRLLVAWEKLIPFGSAAVVRVLLYAAEFSPDLSTQHTACLQSYLIRLPSMLLQRIMMISPMSLPWALREVHNYCSKIWLWKITHIVLHYQLGLVSILIIQRPGCNNTFKNRILCSIVVLLLLLGYMLLALYQRRWFNC